MVGPYRDLFEHLNDELSILDVRLKTQVDFLRRNRRDEQVFQGLYISEKEIESLLSLEKSVDHSETNSFIIPHRSAFDRVSRHFLYILNSMAITPILA